jgi:hypothetical protein
MPQARIFPFRRVSVDHMVRGTTRVWWQLEPTFNDAGPYTFQLQLGKTGLRDALDWEDVGPPVINGVLAYDPVWRASGYDLLTHYRVVLKTPTSTYVSQAANCYGELNERDWLIAREIVRKEELRHKFVSTPGYLIKPMRFGKLCRRCRDALTHEVSDSNCPVCNGTGFEVGYHPPLKLQCWDLSTQTIAEDIDTQLKGTTRVDPYVTARVIGFPSLQRDDIWVNAASDERWVVRSIKISAAMRGVPIIYDVTMGLLPFTNAAYAVEVGDEPAARPGPVLPIEGCGAVIVDQNYGGPDNLSYSADAGCAVTGALVHVFKRVDFDAPGNGLEIDRDLAVGRTHTTANGRWTQSLRLDAGDYTILYEKIGEYGPDVVNITVVDPAALAPMTANIPKAPQATKNNFWDI